MITTLYRKLTTLRADIEHNGWRRVGIKIIDRTAIYALSKLFGFPAAWHNPTSTRPYRILVAEMVNELNPRVVCEVGCGLGSILKRVRAEQRIGYDIDTAVLRAARLLNSRVTFLEGSLRDVSMRKMDVLILVNWIHDLSPDDLASQLKPLLPMTGYLLLDTIDAGVPGYRYNHDFSFLEGFATHVKSRRQRGDLRTFQLYEITT